MAAAQRFFVSTWTLKDPKFAKFPVKFPVSREFPWRQVRSALRRQPGSPAREIIPRQWQKSPPIAGFCNSHAVSTLPIWANGNPKLPKVSGNSLNYSYFRQTATGSISTSWPGYSANALKLSGSAAPETKGFDPSYTSRGFKYRCRFSLRSLEINHKASFAHAIASRCVGPGWRNARCVWEFPQ